jgi:hypothetical protein
MFVRVVRFEDVDQARMAALTARIEADDGPPPGVPMKGMKFLVDSAQGTAISLQYYETAEDMATAARVLDAMDSGETPGTRVSVDSCEVKLTVQVPQGANA